METRQIQIRFTEKTEKGEYSDALYFPLDAYNNGEIKEEDIALEKATRVANWVEMIKNPPVAEVVEKTPEELQAEIAALEQQALAIEQQKVELSTLKEEAIFIKSERIRIAIEEAKVLEEPVVKDPVDEILGVR